MKLMQVCAVSRVFHHSQGGSDNECVQESLPFQPESIECMQWFAQGYGRYGTAAQCLRAKAQELSRPRKESGCWDCVPPSQSTQCCSLVWGRELLLRLCMLFFRFASRSQESIAEYSTLFGQTTLLRLQGAHDNIFCAYLLAPGLISAGNSCVKCN